MPLLLVFMVISVWLMLTALVCLVVSVCQQQQQQAGPRDQPGSYVPHSIIAETDHARRDGSSTDSRSVWSDAELARPTLQVSPPPRHPPAARHVHHQGLQRGLARQCSSA